MSSVAQRLKYGICLIDYNANIVHLLYTFIVRCEREINHRHHF